MLNKILISMTFVMFLFTGCGKDGSYVPDTYVNYQITVQEFNIKKSSNGVLLIPSVGVAGIMIVQSGSGYVAFDRCSAVKPENLCKVAPDDTGITATDPCTGAKWLLLDGSPQKAPAVRNLKQYSVSIQGSQIIQISN